MSNSAATTVRTGIIKGIDISAYLVKDPQKQTAFYRDVLGMVPTETDPDGRGTEFTLADGSTFGVWKPDDGATGGAFMFAVDDIHEAVAEFRSRGLELGDPMETPVCHMAFAADPEGNALIIHQRKNKD
ncbi:MAG: VOC family protein [Candidatus Baltobacteraceae bacterium]